MKNPRVIPVIFGRSDEQNEFGACVDLDAPWGDLPRSVNVTLWVRHSFEERSVDQDSALELNIYATDSDGEGRATGNEVPLNEEAFPFYPSRDHTIPLTLGDVQDGNAESLISAECNRLLEEFVNTLVTRTTCTLQVNEDTGDLTAKLFWKETGDLIVETTFVRNMAKS